MAAEASSGTEASSLRRMRVLLGPWGRRGRERDVGCVGERTQAMRVWLGRERYRVRSPSPRPRLAPVMRMVVWDIVGFCLTKRL